jgi:hypothetical protein
MKSFTLLFILVFCNILQAQNNEILTVPYNGNTPTPSKPIDTNNEDLIAINDTHSKLIVEAYMPISLPQGQFNELSNGMWGLGLGGGVLYNPFSNAVNTALIRPYILGLQLDYTWFSSSSSHSKTTFNQRNFDVEYKLNTGAFSFGYQGKIEFFNTKIYPFIAYQAGFRYFEGVQKIKYTAEYDADQQYAPADVSDNISGSFTTYLGYGGGLGFGKEALRVEIKVMNQMGSQASYIEPNSVVANPNNTFTYTRKKSATNMVVPQLTLSLHF